MLQSEQTRERIVAAAAQLFVRKGYAATSMADLSRSVEMTKGALYHHFESKEAIFLAVVRAIRTTWRDTVGRQVVSTPNAIERMELLLDNQGRFLEKNESFCLVLNGLLMEMEGVNPEFHSILQDVYNELARFIEQVIRKGQAAREVRDDLDPKLAALAVVGMLRGTGCSRPLSERMTVDYPAMMETLKKVLINGLRP
jgi:AcrR family transcriptional regulator